MPAVIVSVNSSIQNALFGALVADAVAMPVHWYYNTDALDRDYAPLDGYKAPRNPHPDSILWRSHYKARNQVGEILHDQAQYWGQRGIHYHQHLPAGDNTLNFLLAVQLYRSTVRAGAYDPDAWLDLYIKLMQSPGWHRDTYVEEYHRAFFDRLASGKSPRDCGIDDIHIGGLTSVPFLVAALDALGEPSAERDAGIVAAHVALTHQNKEVISAAQALTHMLHEIAAGTTLHRAIEKHGRRWLDPGEFAGLSRLPDRQVVGRRYSPACYLPESFTASLFLTWKYADDFEAGILANALCGGDNCHRGAVVGALLGAANEIPKRWLHDLKSMERLRCDTLDPVFAS